VDPVATSELIMEQFNRASGRAHGEGILRTRRNAGAWAPHRRLNELGFDVEEYAIKTTQNGPPIQLQPKVVDAGHHMRRLLRLTGIDAQENQHAGS
jgi:hypothetical protein